MDKRLEIIDNLRIGIQRDMEAVLMIKGVPMEECQSITQNYLLLQMLDTLERIDKTLYLIAANTGGCSEQ